jgi:hypothetical protein
MMCKTPHAPEATTTRHLTARRAEGDQQPAPWRFTVVALVGTYRLTIMS